MSPIAKIIEDYSIVEDIDEGNNIYSQGWYGELTEDKTLKLGPHETILLIERKRIEPLNEKNKVMVLSQVVAFYSEQIPDFLVHYLLYKDLRGRGYVVKKNSSEDTYFRLYHRGASPNKQKEKEFALVVPMIEGVLFNIDEIDLIVNQASELGLKLIFAVIDSLGDVSYYSVDSLEFPNLTKNEVD